MFAYASAMDLETQERRASKKTESNSGQATRPCRCVGGSQIVTPEKPSHPPLSPPPCRIGTAELGVLALCETLPARLPPLGPIASRPTLLRASCLWRICRATVSDPEQSEASPQSPSATVVRSASPMRDHLHPALLCRGLWKQTMSSLPRGVRATVRTRRSS